MRDHTSLLAWQVSRTVVIGAFGLARLHWSPVAAPMLSQLQRAALSVQLNIAEGHALGSPASFRRHLRIAYGSAVESGEIIRLLTDLELAPGDDLAPLLEHNVQSQRLIMGLLKRTYRP